jgi:hypothetical protein
VNLSWEARESAEFPSPGSPVSRVAEDGLDDAARTAVEAVIDAGGVLQRLVAGDDPAGPDSARQGRFISDKHENRPHFVL